MCSFVYVKVNISEASYFKRNAFNFNVTRGGGGGKKQFQKKMSVQFFIKQALEIFLVIVIGSIFLYINLTVTLKQKNEKKNTLNFIFNFVTFFF